MRQFICESKSSSPSISYSSLTQLSRISMSYCQTPTQPTGTEQTFHTGKLNMASCLTSTMSYLSKSELFFYMTSYVVFKKLKGQYPRTLSPRAHQAMRNSGPRCSTPQESPRQIHPNIKPTHGPYADH
jgi:hypothetical protein